MKFTDTIIFAELGDNGRVTRLVGKCKAKDIQNKNGGFR